jgi:hypothetical protein
MRQFRGFSLAITTASILTFAIGNRTCADQVVILHDDPASATGDGAVSLLNASTLATVVSAPAVNDSDRGKFNGTGFLGVQSDGTIFSLINPTDDPDTPGFEGDGAIYARRPQSTLLPIGGEEGAGVPATSLTIYNGGANSGAFKDFIFMGFNGIPGLISNTQVRIPDLSRIAQQGMDGLNGGPGQFGDGPIGPSVMNSSGDLIFLYEDSTQPLGGQGRIRRSAGGNLASGAGDQGLATDANSQQIYGVALGIQSDDQLVLAESNRIVQLRTSNSNLSPDLGGFERNTGQAIGFFDADIADVAVLGDDRVIVGLTNGELHLFSDTLQTQTAVRTLGAAAGDFTITSLAVQSNNEILVGTEQGSLFLLNTSLTDVTPARTGLGSIADILVVPGGSAPIAGDFNGDSMVNGSDLTVWRGSYGQSGANLDADGDADGDVDGSDFLIWQRALGAGVGSLATTSAVPEPCAAVCWLSGMAILGLCRRRQ